MKSSASLCLLSLVLHSVLVAAHVVLLGIWAKGLEHRFVFGLEHQKIASFLITAITQTFGTVCIVFVRINAGFMR